jgi:hypothetical protein
MTGFQPYGVCAVTVSNIAFLHSSFFIHFTQGVAIGLGYDRLSALRGLCGHRVHYCISSFSILHSFHLGSAKSPDFVVLKAGLRLASFRIENEMLESLNF